MRVQRAAACELFLRMKRLQMTNIIIRVLVLSPTEGPDNPTLVTKVWERGKLTVVSPRLVYEAHDRPVMAHLPGQD